MKRAFVDQYAEVRADFNGEMTAKLSEDELAQARTEYEVLFGTFESMGEPDVLHSGDLTVVNIPLHMASQDGQARITYDADGEIAGLYLLRTGVPVP